MHQNQNWNEKLCAVKGNHYMLCGVFFLVRSPIYVSVHVAAYHLIHHIVHFPCRLYERRKKMEAKLAAVRAAAEHPVDPATGRPLFQPAIGRAPHYRRNQHGLPVGEYLYGMR